MCKVLDHTLEAALQLLKNGEQIVEISDLNAN
jgi:hypothetical protein